MAVQDAKNFLDAVDQDPELRTRVKGAFHQIVETAQQNGYNISAKDLADELRRRWGMNPQTQDGADPDTFCIG
jgi:predicted ribosomally synthesized peptide with nif11-like leader